MKAKMMLKISANIGTLEGAWNTAKKGRLVRRDIGSVSKDIGDAFEATGRKMGPATAPRDVIKGSNMNPNLGGKMFIQGDSGKHLENIGLKDTIKSKTRRGEERRGLNATMNHHELDELKEFNKHGAKGQTIAGAGLGHHSYAKILGRESNRAVKAEDTATKLGTKAVTRFRTKTGEKEVFDKLALKDSKGNTPMKYGRDRMNRSYLKAMYKKEKNMDTKDYLKALGVR